MTARPQPTAPSPQVPAGLRARDWDESPREAAAADDRYWDDLYDRDED
jgi:hypothetical protein